MSEQALIVSTCEHCKMPTYVDSPYERHFHSCKGPVPAETLRAWWEEAKLGRSRAFQEANRAGERAAVWHAKFQQVKHENNQLRKRLRKQERKAAI